MTTEAATTPAPLLTGYASNIVLFASRYKQGGRTVYSLDLSPEQIVGMIDEPDVDTPSPGNRRIRPAHAEAFGKYFRENKDWISPSIMLRGPEQFDFDVQSEVGGIQFGLLSIPRRMLSDLHIVDGQHRISGMFRAEKAIRVDIDKARSHLATVRRNDAGGRGEEEARARIAELEAQRARLGTEMVNVQIFIESDPKAYRQMFFDIADNQLGITASVKTRFDSRKVVNRALMGTLEHRLLKGRVDPESDRMGRGSPNLMGAKHVAEIIRSVTVGLEGRVSRRQEAEFKEEALIARAHTFFDLLIESFPQIQALTLGQITADDLRKTSMLGSVIFVRVLAGVFHELREHAWEDSDIAAFYKKLAPHLSVPFYQGSIWLEQLPAIFSEGGSAVHGRRQDIAALKNALVAWAIDKPAFLDAPPAPRPEPEEEWVDPEQGAGYSSYGADVPTK